ncbi:glycosyltransferase family 4 protein [Rhizobium sp. CG4]|nr:glycosyltransferase family 4 protein [Rhizobium sp. CG4]
MRILLTTYHQAFINPAGGEAELQQLSEFLNDVGARAEIYGPQSKRLGFYDAVIHFSTHGGGEGLLRDIKAAGKPIILVPNFNFFDLDHKSIDVVQRHLDLADIVVLRTQVEYELCQRNFVVPGGKITIVPPGIASGFGRPAEDGLFQAAYGMNEFILWVGQLAEHKRQLETIVALKNVSVPLVFIGGYADRTYYETCRAMAGDNVRFLPYMLPASEILRSAMQSCSLYLELGDDAPGFSVLEAALAGSPLLLRDHPWSRELLGDIPTYLPSNPFDCLLETVLEKTSGVSAQIRDADKWKRYIQPNPTIEMLDLISDFLKR